MQSGMETGEDNNGGRENRQKTTDADMNERRWHPGPGRWQGRWVEVGRFKSYFRAIIHRV